MKNPILTVKGNMLNLELPGWNSSQVDAIKQNLICWRLKPKSINILVAEPLALAQWEVKEQFPRITISEETREELRFLILRHTQPKIQDWIKEDLFPIQREPANLLHARERALLTAAPGLGKTVISLVALRNLVADLVVIVVPLTSLDGWREEVERWYIPKAQTMVKMSVWREIDDVRVLREEEEGKTELILTTPNVINGIQELQSSFGEGLASVFYDARYLSSFLILDESFLYQNRKSGRTNIISELSENFRTIWLLSGMPVSKVNDDLFSQLKILYPKSFRSYWKFAGRYCLLETNFWGTKIVGNKPNSEQLLLRDLADIIVNCDYPKDVPEWIPVEVEVPMEPVQEQIYLEAKEKLLIEAKHLKSKKTLPIKRLISLTTRLLQIASNPLLIGSIVEESSKWNKLIELIREDDLPCLVWVKYKATADRLLGILREEFPKLDVEVLTGNTKSSQRYALVKKFQEGDLDILIINDAVGKYSLTLTAARVAYYLERNFDGEAYYQSLFRARRITSKHPVKIVLLKSTYADGSPTIDQLVHEALLERSQNAQLLTVGELVGRC